jgi:membrane-associated phospholipid phosphatase
MVKLLRQIDKSTKWLVSATVATVAVIWTDKEDVGVPYYILAAVITAVAGKGLKRVLAVSRPEGAPSRVTGDASEYGMPSSHAVSASFLAFAACIGVFKYTYPYAENGRGPTLQEVQSAFCFGPNRIAYLGLELAGCFVAALRVVVGHHTVPQAIVGYCFGTSMAVLAAYIDFEVYNGISSSLTRSEKDFLIIAFMMASVLFAVKYVRKWARSH